MNEKRHIRPARTAVILLVMALLGISSTTLHAQANPGANRSAPIALADGGGSQGPCIGCG